MNCELIAAADGGETSNPTSLVNLYQLSALVGRVVAVERPDRPSRNGCGASVTGAGNASFHQENCPKMPMFLTGKTLPATTVVRRNRNSLVVANAAVLAR